MDHLKTKAGIEVEDMGTDKYYVAAADVAKRVQDDKSTKGMLFCGTGMGVGIVANKFTGVYAATCENEAAARHSRSINNSNILAMGGLVTTVDDAIKVGGVLVSRRDRCHRHRHRRRYRRRRRRRHSPRHFPPFVHSHHSHHSHLTHYFHHPRLPTHGSIRLVWKHLRLSRTNPTHPNNLHQEFCAKPGAEADWWSPEVEAFLSSKFPEIDSIEQDSRGR